MKWFRFHSEALDSKKVQDLSPVLFKFWINLLALANNEDPRGTLPGDEEVAFRLRIPPKKTSEWINELVGRGLVDDNPDTVVMHNWDKWQRASDNAAERMANTRRTSSEDVPNKFALDTDRDKTRTEQKEDTEAEERGRIFRLYEDLCGSVNPVTSEKLLELESEFSEECLAHCFEEAALSNGRNLKYVTAILDRHAREGCSSDNGANPDFSDPQLRELERQTHGW